MREREREKGHKLLNLIRRSGAPEESLPKRENVGSGREWRTNDREATARERLVFDLRSLNIGSLKVGLQNKRGLACSNVSKGSKTLFQKASSYLPNVAAHQVRTSGRAMALNDNICLDILGGHRLILLQLCLLSLLGLHRLFDLRIRAKALDISAKALDGAQSKGTRHTHKRA